MTSAHLRREWTAGSFRDLNDRASHPCGVFDGDGLSVFAKIADGPDGAEQLRSEVAGLQLLYASAQAATARPLGAGVIDFEDCSVLVLEALPELDNRDDRAWRSIGCLLASIHGVSADRFGGDFDGFFGPYRQQNRPVESNRWSDFYRDRRVLPYLQLAVESGNLPSELATAVEKLVPRLDELCGPEPTPRLLHGDAQQNNYVSTSDGAYMVDVAPYFGHPELDLALVDVFEPVPVAVFDAYREVADIDAGFEGRRELWRIFSYLAIVANDGGNPFGQTFVGRLADAIDLYR